MILTLPGSIVDSTASSLRVCQTSKNAEQRNDQPWILTSSDPLLEPSWIDWLRRVIVWISPCSSAAVPQL